MKAKDAKKWLFISDRKYTKDIHWVSVGHIGEDDDKRLNDTDDDDDVTSSDYLSISKDILQETL